MQQGSISAPVFLTNFEKAGQEETRSLISRRAGPENGKMKSLGFGQSANSN